MKKCPNCNGCTKTVWIDNKVYKYCEFCNKYFAVELNGNSVEVPLMIINYLKEKESK